MITNKKIDKHIIAVKRRMYDLESIAVDEIYNVKKLTKKQLTDAKLDDKWDEVAPELWSKLTKIKSYKPSPIGQNLILARAKNRDIVMWHIKRVAGFWNEASPAFLISTKDKK